MLLPLSSFAGLRRVTERATAGEGATAAVWEAIDTKVGRHVAIKIPRSENGKERLEQEARVLSSVAHPNIVQYIDWFKDADPAFIVIEFLQGCR